MSDYASLITTYVEFEARPSIPASPSGRIRIWCNSSDNDNLYAQDEIGSNTQITNDGVLATGNAQYLWDWFENGEGVSIPEYSAVTLVQGGVNDGKIMLADSDDTTKDSFLGMTYGGTALPGASVKVIYAGKVPNAVLAWGVDSRTLFYLSNNPGQITYSQPNFQTQTIFSIGFSKGPDLYLRPIEISDLG